MSNSEAGSRKHDYYGADKTGLERSRKDISQNAQKPGTGVTPLRRSIDDEIGGAVRYGRGDDSVLYS